MKKIIFVISCALFLFPTVSLGASLVSDQNVDIINPILENTYISGQNLNISANINGDLVAAGMNLNIENDIRGSLIAAAANVNISANIMGSARLATGKTSITGVIGGDLFIFGGDVNIAKNTVINGDLIVFGGDVKMDGIVYGNIQGSAGTIRIRGTVGKNVKMNIGSSAIFSNDARVSGDFIYSSAYESSVPKNVVLGTVKRNPVELSWRQQGLLGITIGKIYDSFIGFLAITFLALFYCMVASGEVIKIRNLIQKSFFKSLGIGFLMGIATPIAIIIFFVTVIGAPIALILTALFLIIAYMSKIFAASFISGFIFKDTHNKWATFGKITLGLFILMIVGLIPYAGKIIVFALCVPAFGAILVRKYEILKNWKK